MLRNLLSLGFDPKDTDAIILTHSDYDHIGGVLDEVGKLEFPNDRYYLSANSWGTCPRERGALQDRNPSGWPEERIDYVWGTYSTIRERLTVVDYDVEKALNVRIQTYKRPGQSRAPKLHPNSLAQEVYEAVKVMCDWRLGSNLQRSGEESNLPADIEPLSIDELIACLKRIRKSVQTWTKRSGRQGYLEFIDQYVS